MDKLEKMVNTIGNLVHDTVPVDNNEDNNLIVKTWGEPNKMKINSKKGACHHHEILSMIGGYDPKRG